MRWAKTLVVITGFLLALTAMPVVAAGPEPVIELELREPLDRDWEPEWVSWPVELPAGRFAEDDLWLVNADGGEVDHAFAVEATHNDGSVRKATAYAWTGLKRGETKRFRVTRGTGILPVLHGLEGRATQGHDTRGTGILPVLHGLEGRATQGHDTRGTGILPVLHGLEGRATRGRVSNTLIEVTQPMGGRSSRQEVETYDVPAEASINCRGKHASGGIVGPELVGTSQVESVMRRPVAAPPHTLAQELVYQLEPGGQYTLRYSVMANLPVVLIEEDFRGIERGGARFSFAPPEAFTHGHGRGRLHPPAKGGLAKGYEIDFSKEWVGRIQPFYAWWNNYGLWWAAYKPDGDYIGILPLNPPEWTNPAYNPIEIHTGPGGKIEVFCPLRNGTRKWAIVLASADEALKRSEGGANLMMKMAIRLGQNPLDKVKDMSLGWPGMDAIDNPRLLCTKPDIPAIRQKARTHPLFKRVLEEFPEEPNDPSGLYLATGDEKHAREAIDKLIPQLRGWVDDALDGSHYGEALLAIGFTRPLRRAALIYDLVADSQSMTADERDYCLRAFAFLMYCLADENRWPDRYQGFARGNVNFHSDDYTCRAAVACLLNGHPLQREWMEFVEREFDLEFDASIYPGGAWCEAPNYQGFTMHYLMLAMRIMQLNGYKDFSKDPRFRVTMDYFFRIQTPFDVRAGHHLLPTVGDTTSYYHSQSLMNVFAWAATLFEDDPELAGRMMHAWKRGGSIVFGAHGLNPGAGWTQPLTMIDPDIPDVPPAEPLQSERLPGYGALLRNGYGTTRESYFLFKMGQADQHYDSDEGSFHWYALGAPLSLDFGSMYAPSIVQPWLHSTLDFGRHAAWTRGEVTTFVSLPDVDFVEGEMAVNDIQRVPELPRGKLPEGVSSVIERGQRFIDWRRQVLFVKGPDYIVLRDDLDDADDQLPTGWTVQVLAHQVDINGQQAGFAGQFGVNLDVHVFEPEGAELTSSTWGHDGEEGPAWVSEKPMPAMGETQIALHMTAPVDGDYLVGLFPSTHRSGSANVERIADDVVRVDRPGPPRATDLIFFSGTRRLMQAENVTFAGRVGVVTRARDRDVVTLHIVEGVSMRVPEIIAQFPGPVTLELYADGAFGDPASGAPWPGRVIRGVCDGQARTCFLHWTDPPPTPATLTIDGQPRYVYSTFDGYLRFSVEAGRHEFELRYPAAPGE